MKVRYDSTVNPRIKSLDEMLQLQGPELKTIATRIDSAFGKHERGVFASEGASGGARWPALKHPKPLRFRGTKILQRTGKLRKSLTNRKSGDHVFRWSLQPTPTVTVGSNVSYGEHHVRGLRPLKKRDPMQHTQVQEDAYTDIAKEYFTKTKLPRIQRVLSAWRRGPAVRRRAA